MPVRQITHDEEVKLTQAALDARNASYSPYSKFRVGACLLSDDGKYWPGCNVENASYGGCICAERTACVKAVSEGSQRFIGLAVATDVDAAVSPCGMCRQFLREFCPLDANADPDARIFIRPFVAFLLGIPRDRQEAIVAQYHGRAVTSQFRP